jgi:tyrosine-protein kinase Etk/Wzc
LKEAGTVAGFDIIAPAITPTIPISPKKMLFYGIATGVGIFLSLALVLLQYVLHDTITSQKDLEKLTHLPILGAVPRYKKEKLVYSQLLIHLNPKSSMSEAFRSIRTNLDFMFPNSKADKSRFSQKIISITSNISGEGKTFVTANLGGIIAYSGLKVVILDLDMRKPKIHFAFKTDNDKGVSTILIGKHSIEECIKKTEIPNLDFITAGALPPNPSELILTEDFTTLLSDLKKIYDVVLLDTPPVGLVTDGFLIMQNTDARLFVLRADYSKKVFAKNVNRIVQNNKIARVGLILNSVDNNGGAYGYGYSYGGYYEDNNLKSPTLWERIKLFFKTNLIDRFSK